MARQQEPARLAHRRHLTRMPRKVTLTFDNGPDPQVTPFVLDCLARHDLKTTFFVLGEKVSHPAGARLARRASEEGHRIGNHTFTHTVPLGNLDRTTALAEFERTEQALEWLIQPQRLFRPFGGGGAIGPHLLHPAVLDRLESGGFTCVLWNCVPGDWKHPDAWVDRALEDCRSLAWSLVVLHDLPTGAMAHLDEFIHRLSDEGVEFTRDYPPDCLPIVGGRIILPMAQYTREP
jgi:peptidoglycan/xylan/chitin deacetylase (PgdA/CDA1 family)